MKPVRISWFAHYNLDCPSARYRGLLLLEFMRKNYDIDYKFIYPDRKPKKVIQFILSYLKALISVRNNDWIVIQKVCTNRHYAFLLKLLVRIRRHNTLYDIDDAEYIRQDVKSMHYFMKRCTIITVGSEALKLYAKEFNTNVYVVTSGIYEHANRKKKRNKKPVIGWVGNMGNGNLRARDFSHKKSVFELLFPAIKNLDMPCRLELIGVILDSDKKEIEEYFADSPQVELHIPMNLNWRQDDWLYEMISLFDIGAAPMVDHAFNQAKSAFKVKQYLSCGVPAIASNIGENKTFIQDGKNGFLCDTHNDFKDAISTIISMSDDRYNSMSEAALQSKHSFSFQIISQQIHECMDNQKGGRHSSWRNKNP
jgi:glycosyltransferase involved in cell wall biosynthesis